MCWFVYVASDHPLERIEENDPRYPELRVHTDGTSGAEEIVRSAIGVPYIAYAIPSGGCGCAFQYDTEAEVRRLWDDVPSPELDSHLDKRLKEKMSVDSLARYLTAMNRMGSALLYVVWAEEEGTATEHRRKVDADFFNGEEFGWEAGIYELVG